MKRLLALLTKKPMPALFKLATFLAAIWFLFPYISVAGYAPFLDDAVKYATGGAAIGVWLVWQAFEFWTERQRNRKIVEGLMAAPAAAPLAGADARAADQIEKLKKRLEVALDYLGRIRKTKGQWRRNYLYELPWYILIGPPGSGKSTALRASGLKFIFENDAGDLEVKGIGGTRDCDWIFADQAVLLDTAGRYVTQDSEPEADKAAWLGFLKLLKTHRPRQPINGILVVVSVYELLKQSEHERTQHARKIRERVNELYTKLALRAPVYVLLTKCDLVAGFNQFFSNLGQDERKQVWGMTFPLEERKDAPPLVHRFTAEVEQLERRLNTRLLTCMQEEMDPARRDLIYTFPQEFSPIKALAQSFLNRIFEPNRFEEPFLLRGVYFTSGTQQGTPLDQLLGSVAAGLGINQQALPPLSGKGKSYFLQRVLTDVLFREANLAGTDIALERRQAWLRRGAYIGTAAVAASTLGAWGASYFSNGQLIGQTEQEIAALKNELAAVRPEQTSVLDVLPVLDRARALPGGYGQGTQWFSALRGLGLDELDKIGEGSKTAYEEVLTNAFLPRIMLAIEEGLRRDTNNLNTLRNTLGVYLMLGNNKRFDRDTVQERVTTDWDKHLPNTVSTEQRTRLHDHLAALVNLPLGVPPRPLDARLTAQSRNILQQLSPTDRVYAAVKQSADALKLPEFRVSGAAGRDAPRVFAREAIALSVPGLFTLDGQKVFRAEAERRLAATKAEAWIAGQDNTDTAMNGMATQLADLENRFHRDYEEAWSRFLNNINVVPITSVAQAAEVLRLLSAPESPLRQLLMAITKATLPDAQVPAEKKAGKQPGTIVDKVKAWKEQVAGQLNEAVGTELIERPFVPKVLADLNDLVSTTEGQPAAIDGMLKSLNELYVQVDAVLSASEGGGLVPADLKARVAIAAAQVERDAKGQPAVVRNVAGKAGAGAAQVSSSRANASQYGKLDADWKSSVVNFYQRAVGGRYPLLRGGTGDVTLDDFARFFGPGGALDAFFQQNLKDFVDASKGAWRMRPGYTGPHVSAGTLRALQQADVIRNAFFTAGPTPGVAFAVRPVRLDQRAARFSLEIDGQLLVYSHGPIREMEFMWPGTGDTSQARILFAPAGGGRDVAKTEMGPWAWFKLLQSATISPTAQPEKFNVTFTLESYQADVEIRASSAFNPFGVLFSGAELESFRCPPTL